MAKMTPRERVMTALRHEEPDRVPLDIGGGNSTSVLVETNDKLNEFFGIQAETRIANRAFRVAVMEEEAMVRLESDLRPIRLKGPKNWKAPPSEPGTYVDELGIKWREVPYPGGFFYESVGAPLAEATISDLDKFPWPDPDDPGRYEGLEAEVRDAYENTPYALLADFGYKGFWEPAFMMRGYGQALMDLVLNPEFIHALMEKLFEVNAGVAKRFLEIVGPYVVAVRTADDLATQKAPMMSPATYRALVKPYQKRLNDVMKQYTDAKIFYHSCGNVSDLVGDLIEAGFEALNPVQVAAIPDPAGLKARYGDKISFWGAIDTQHVLPHGTPEDVREEVKRRVHQLGHGGGFIAAAVHNMQPDIPPQNIVAMSEAVREFGVYPLA